MAVCLSHLLGICPPVSRQLFLFLLDFLPHLCHLFCFSVSLFCGIFFSEFWHLWSLVNKEHSYTFRDPNILSPPRSRGDVLTQDVSGETSETIREGERVSSPQGNHPGCILRFTSQLCGNQSSELPQHPSRETSEKRHKHAGKMLKVWEDKGVCVLQGKPVGSSSTFLFSCDRMQSSLCIWDKCDPSRDSFHVTSLCYCGHLLLHPCQTPMDQEDHCMDQGVRHWNRSTVLQARRAMQKFGSCCSSVYWKHRTIKRAQKPIGKVGQNPGLTYWFADHGENPWSLWCLQSLLGTAGRRKDFHACHSVTPSEESRATWDCWDVFFVQPRAPLLGLPPAEGFSSKGAYRTFPPHLVAWTV